MTLLTSAAQRHIPVGGGVTVIAPPSATGGRYSLYRIDLPPLGLGARPHYHHAFVESFTVLTGTVALLDGDRWVSGQVGDHLVVPELGVHAFRNDTDEPASLLMLSTPGAAREDYFDELIEVAGRELTAGQWSALFARHDQVMVEDPTL
ncbi:MAG: cupin [Frankiales bacterium]|nr:cupin [Frankiales bacterium]